MAGSVQDNNGTGVDGVADFGSVLVDTSLPTATLISDPTVNAAAAASSTTTVTIDYSDATSDVDTSTFGTGNSTVSNGATVIGYFAVGNTVTYTITAAGANWAGGAQGTHTVALVAGSVKDLAGNPIAGDSDLGSFAVDVSICDESTTTAGVTPHVARPLARRSFWARRSVAVWGPCSQAARLPSTTARGSWRRPPWAAAARPPSCRR